MEENENTPAVMPMEPPMEEASPVPAADNMEEASPAPVADNAVRPAAIQGGIYLNAAAMGHLIKTRPWVRFISILFFISAGFAVIGSIFAIVIGFLATIIPDAAYQTTFLQAVPSLATGFFYIIVAIAYIPMGLFLSRYAKDIRTLETEHSPEILESALKQQKMFWRYAGIIIIVSICLMAIALPLTIFFTIFMR